MRTGCKVTGAVALFAAAAACGGDGGTGPTNGGGASLAPRYELAEYGGTPLPAVEEVVVEQPAGGGAPVQCEQRLTSMSIDFMSRTRYSAIAERLEVCDDGRPNVATVRLEMGSYSVRSDSLRLTADLTPDGVSHRAYALISADSVNVYRRETAAPNAGTVVDPTRLVFLASP